MRSGFGSFVPFLRFAEAVQGVEVIALKAELEAQEAVHGCGNSLPCEVSAELRVSGCRVGLDFTVQDARRHAYCPLIPGLRKRHSFDLVFLKWARRMELGKERGMDAIEKALALFIGADGFGKEAVFATIGGGFLFTFGRGGTF